MALSYTVHLLKIHFGTQSFFFFCYLVLIEKQLIVISQEKLGLKEELLE
jgi:hypothetical protein